MLDMGGKSETLTLEMKTLGIIAALILPLSCLASGAVTVFDFEGATVPPEFTLTGTGGAFSQSLTTSNVYEGAQSLRLSLTTSGSSQWAQTTVGPPSALEHVSFSIYDEYASNSPVYYYFFLTDSTDDPLTTDYGLDYADGGFGYPTSTSVLMFGSNTIPDYTRTVGWHVIDAFISVGSISYSIDGNHLGTVVTDPSIHVDTVEFAIASSGHTGQNSLLIDNLTLTTVSAIPEPGSMIALGCFFASGLMLRKR